MSELREKGRSKHSEQRKGVGEGWILVFQFYLDNSTSEEDAKGPKDCVACEHGATGDYFFKCLEITKSIQNSNIFETERIIHTIHDSSFTCKQDRVLGD